MNDHNPSELGPVFQGILWGEPRGAFDNPAGQSLLKIYQHGVGNELTNKLVHDLVHPLKIQELFGRLPPFLKPRFRGGEITVKTLTGEWLKFGVAGLGKHILLPGSTGAGKSSLLINWSLQFAFWQITTWFFEFSKFQFRHLVPLFALLRRQLIVLRKETIKVNPLQAGRCNLRAHQAMITDQLLHVLEVPGERSRSLLTQALNDLYGKFGNWTGNQDQWPVLPDVYQWFYDRSGANPAARQAMLDRLAALIPDLGRFYRLGWHPIDLGRESLVWELSKFPGKARQLVVGPVLFSLMQYEYEHGAFNLPFHHCIFCDDSQWLFHGRENGGHSPVLELIETIRGCGRSLGFSLQTGSELPRRFTGNCNARIAGILNTHADWATLGADMGMTPEQIQWAKMNLRPGWFIAQLADSDWRHPFPFRIEEPKLPQVVSDLDAQATVKALSHLPVEPATEYDDWKPHHLVELSATAAPAMSPLTAAELRYVKAVMAQPGQPSRGYAKAAGLSGTEAKAIRERLVRAGFLREHLVVTGKRGRAAQILEPLPAALEAVAHMTERSNP